MTAVISRERARTTGLTAAAGVLMLAVAFVMMIVAAPDHGTARIHGPAKRSTAQQSPLGVCHQVTPRGDSARARACLAGPSADSAWADAYVPSMTSESWSASSSDRAARPPLASAVVS